MISSATNRTSPKKKFKLQWNVKLWLWLWLSILKMVRLSLRGVKKLPRVSRPTVRRKG
nr:MAG TPA: PROTEIN ANTIBIOTIC [Caudoviricetes sp.]